MPTTMAAVVIRIGRRRTAAGSLDCGPPIEPLLFLQAIGELDHQNAVLRNESDQRHKPDLGIDVDRGEPEIHRQQGAEHCRRQRHQNDEGIAEALELGRENEIDDDEGEEKGDGKRVAFLHILACFPAPIIGHAFGKQFRRLGSS